jgi:hypothetical protein
MTKILAHEIALTKKFAEHDLREAIFNAKNEIGLGMVATAERVEAGLTAVEDAFQGIRSMGDPRPESGALDVMWRAHKSMPVAMNELSPYNVVGSRYDLQDFVSGVDAMGDLVSWQSTGARPYSGRRSYHGAVGDADASSIGFDGNRCLFQSGDAADSLITINNVSGKDLRLECKIMVYGPSVAQPVTLPDLVPFTSPQTTRAETLVTLSDFLDNITSPAGGGQAKRVTQVGSELSGVMTMTMKISANSFAALTIPSSGVADQHVFGEIVIAGVTPLSTQAINLLSYDGSPKGGLTIGRAIGELSATQLRYLHFSAETTEVIELVRKYHEYLIETGGAISVSHGIHDVLSSFGETELKYPANSVSRADALSLPFWFSTIEDSPTVEGSARRLYKLFVKVLPKYVGLALSDLKFLKDYSRVES